LLSFIGGGRPAARSALFLSALMAMRHNPQMKTSGLLALARQKMVALIAGFVPCDLGPHA
jgi:hypothetical protein